METPEPIDETSAFTPRFDARGLIPAIAQDAETGEVLMMAWMNEEALELTRRSGEVHYWSRSRQAIWRKGETSGHTQELVRLWVDCDQDTLLVSIRQKGPACHTGRRSCFYRHLAPSRTAGDLHDGLDFASETP